MVNVESTLLSQSECLSVLLGSLDESIVATDENFVVQFWNKKAEQLFGLTAAEAIGQKGASVLTFTYPSQSKAAAKQQLIEKGVWKGHLHYHSADGRLLLLDASVTVVRNRFGDTIGYVGVHRDITDYDRAKTSLDTFLSLMSSTGDYFFVVDTGMRIAFIDDNINKRLTEVYGFDCAIGDHVVEKLPAERREKIRICFEKALQGQRIGYEQQIRTANGQPLWVQATYFPVRNEHGFITHACSLVRDITPQKKIELVNEMLYNSRKVFEVFMENSPIMSWITDKAGIVKYLNPAYLKAYSLTKDVIGKPLQAIFPHSDLADLQENNALVYRSNESVKFIETAVTPDGIGRTYQVVKFPLKTEEDTFIGGWAIDITQENELRRNLSESLLRLKKSEKELKESLAKEHQLNEMKSQFVSMASHEFRTPLSTILSSVYLLEKYTTAEQQPSRLKHAGKIKGAIEHLNSLLEDFLTLGKLDEGKTTVAKTPFDFLQLLSEVQEELELLKKRGQVIDVQYTGAETIVSDKKIMKNILLNLLSNALKFSGEDKPVYLQATNANGTLSVTIIDEGIGICKTDKEHLFQTFFRGKNAQNIQGTGLGLNIVNRYLELLGGSISIDSELNKGTVAHLTIPSVD
jgi:PAS domain S-box-containing protein